MLYNFTNTNKHGILRSRIMSDREITDVNEIKAFGNDASVLEFKYLYKNSYLPPTLVKTRSGKKFITPDWKEVHPDTRLSDINWVKPKAKKPKVEEIKVETNEFKFESKSDPGSFYVVSVVNGKVKCTCSGQYRAKDRKCRHMKEVIKKLGL